MSSYTGFKPHASAWPLAHTHCPTSLLGGCQSATLFSPSISDHSTIMLTNSYCISSHWEVCVSYIFRGYLRRIALAKYDLSFYKMPVAPFHRFLGVRGIKMTFFSFKKFGGLASPPPNGYTVTFNVVMKQTVPDNNWCMWIDGKTLLAGYLKNRLKSSRFIEWGAKIRLSRVTAFFGLFGRPEPIQDERFPLYLDSYLERKKRKGIGELCSPHVKNNLLAYTLQNAMDFEDKFLS